MLSTGTHPLRPIFIAVNRKIGINTTVHVPIQMEEISQEHTFIDHLATVVLWRRMILWTFVVATVGTAVVSLTLPKVYRATATVFPPQDSSDMLGGLSSLLADLPVNLLGLSGSGVSATDFVPVVESERVKEAVAERFGLMDRYETETREELLLVMEGLLEVELSREQFLAVSYEAETPELAAQLTNAFVEELDRALRDRKNQQSGALRQYFAVRLTEALTDVQNAEQAYRTFQSQHMAIDLETQANAQIETTGEVVSQLAELIIRRDVASAVMESGHPKLKKLELEVEATRGAIDRMLMGGANGAVADLPDIVIPFRAMPELGLEALQLMRDVKINNAIYTFVRQEYERARLEEDKETALVILLDEAKPPDTRSKPRRTIMVLLAGGLSLALSTLLAFFFEAVRGMDESRRQKLDSILAELRRKP